MRKSVKLRFAIRCAWADAKRRYVTTPIDKAQAALNLLEQAVASAQARRQATNDRDAKNAATVAAHEKTIAELTARAASAENALNALTDKVSALTSNIAGLS